MDDVLEQISRKIRATSRPPSGDTVFALVRNNCTVREPCGVCGSSHKDAGTPAWVFSKSGSLCWLCATELAPDLHRCADGLEALHWLPTHLGVETPSDVAVVERIYSSLPRLDKVRWDNLPDFAEMLKVLDDKVVRARIAELRRLDAANSPIELEEDGRKIIQDPQGTGPMPDDFGDGLPF